MILSDMRFSWLFKKSYRVSIFSKIFEIAHQCNKPLISQQQNIKMRSGILSEGQELLPATLLELLPRKKTPKAITSPIKFKIQDAHKWTCFCGKIYLTENDLLRHQQLKHTNQINESDNGSTQQISIKIKRVKVNENWGARIHKTSALLRYQPFFMRRIIRLATQNDQFYLTNIKRLDCDLDEFAEETEDFINKACICYFRYNLKQYYLSSTKIKYLDPDLFCLTVNIIGNWWSQNSDKCFFSLEFSLELMEIYCQWLYFRKKTDYSVFKYDRV